MLCRGTWPYMSPETRLGKPMGVHDDLRAVCVTIFELLSGKDAGQELNDQYRDVYRDEEICARIQQLRSARGVACETCSAAPAAEVVGAVGIKEVRSLYQLL